MSVVDPLTMRGRARAGFGSLTAGMVLRGSVPPQILVGVAVPPRPPAPEVLTAPPPAPEPAPPPAVAAPPSLEGAPPAPQPVAPRPSGRRRALTLRLDPVHHMRLRLVGSLLKRSAQDLCVAALERYFDSLPPNFPGSHCACLSASATPGDET
jgi:hypothetical protein